VLGVPNVYKQKTPLLGGADKVTKEAYS